jgi:integrase
MSDHVLSQAPLFDLPAPARDRSEINREPLDSDSERLVRAYRVVRLSAGTTASAAAREVSQLRSVVRVARRRHGPVTLATLVSHPRQLADILACPDRELARSTVRARINAIQRFLSVMAQYLGCDGEAVFGELAQYLPMRPSSGWYRVGTLLAGTPVRRRRRGPALYPDDLRGIVAAAAAVRGERGVRDCALVALHCYTGLRPEEVIALRWEDVRKAIAAPGRTILEVHVTRACATLCLPIPVPAAGPLHAWEQVCRVSSGCLSGPIFVRTRRTGKPLSYRAARDIVRTACRQAGLPELESHALRCAAAYWLRTQGLSDHQIAQALGIARVRTIDRMLKPHADLDAQREARAVGIL